MQNITDPATGGSRVLSEQCATCIFRAGNLMFLEPGRLAALVADALPDSFIVCHDTLTYGRFPGYGPAMCRGFVDRYGDRSRAVVLLRLCGRLVEVPPPADDEERTG
ncbi:MAG TPA: hypothetical protein VEO01_24285 [Pseudonocardiaceae bacterium]|nr:hypothetical protein [Pseudonocardiaceae bacterium]